jgi:DnaJ like chaperone protein
MSWWGKLLGGVFGYMLAGPLGALVGVAIGHYFDVGVVRNLREQLDPAEQQRVQMAFFKALFSVMGRLAKVDGRVTESEIAQARDVMQRMNLNEPMRREAIRLFTEGKKPDFPLDQVLTEFRNACRWRRNLVRMFIEILLHAAYVDGRLQPAERDLMIHVCRQLGFSELEFRHLDAMVRNARHFGGGGTGQETQVSPASALQEAYEILGVEQSAGDVEIKKAYRRLLNQHHPDKLVAKGLPEEMTRLANEKTREIQEAYETIKRARGAP